MIIGMKGIKKILSRYYWDRIGVWSLILAGCFGILFYAGTLLASGCNRLLANQPKTSQKEQVAATTPFTLPAIPVLLTDADSRAQFLVAHWWDNLDFADTTWLAHAEFIEQAFVDWLDVMHCTSADAAATSIRATLGKARAQQKAFDWFTAMFDKYLYEPNSPMLDEERYSVVLEHIMADRDIDELYKIRPAHQLEEIGKNRAGTVAADFTYTLPDGSTGRLHGIKADYTLLYFYNPDCTDCKRTKALLEQSEAVSALVSGGRMRVLALYPDDKTEEWKAYAPEIPSAWINARDASAGLDVKNRLYAIRAIPSLYLLDRNKRVLLKDADYIRLEAWLQKTD